jgi:flagellar basal-body rod protein FlgC
MDFLKSIAIAASGMRAQAGRMRIISENIANAESTASSPGGDSYRRRIVTFRDEIDREIDAHVAKGDVKYPNVNPLVGITDFRDAQRSYEANINVISSTRRMLQRTIDILKS